MSDLAYVIFNSMTNNLKKVSFYVLDSNNNKYPLSVIVPSTNNYYYFDNSNASYTAVSFNIEVNGTVIFSIPLNNVQKDALTTIVIAVQLSLTVNVPDTLGTLITQTIQALLAGAVMNIGCTFTVYYVVTNTSNNTQSIKSVNLSLSMVSNSEFRATGSISYSQNEYVTIAQINVSCLGGKSQTNILDKATTSSTCTSSSGCSINITVTFTS